MKLTSPSQWAQGDATLNHCPSTRPPYDNIASHEDATLVAAITLPNVFFHHQAGLPAPCLFKKAQNGGRQEGLTEKELLPEELREG